MDIPLNKIVGIVGVSGSGKSSLALGVLYAEGQLVMMMKNHNNLLYLAGRSVCLVQIGLFTCAPAGVCF